MAKNSLAKHQAGKRPKNGGQGAANRGQKKGQGAVRAGSAFTSSRASSKVGRTTPQGESRVKDKSSRMRTEGTIKRLQMYNKKPDTVRMKEQATKPMRIQPDRRWFGNTRVIAQDKMQAFRETIAKGVEDPFTVVLKASKLPMSLLKETEGKTSRMDLLSIQPYKEVFGKRRQQKRVKLGSYDLESMLNNVNKKNEKHEASGKGMDVKEDRADYVGTHGRETIMNKGTSKRIWGELYKVVDSSDVIVFVLDARDPMGTRCLKLEKEIRKNKAHKHVVLVLNKVDLVPTWVSRRWIQILMKDFPTLAFHASITNPFGKNSLLNLLKQFSTLMSDKKHITVGMIGYPNVGKSSVINTLRRKKVCKSAPIPGETRVWQYVALTRKLFLLDCPGIVPLTSSDLVSDTAKILKGAIRAERLSSPSDYIDEVVARVKPQYLQQKYKLEPEVSWADGESFLRIIALKMGKLLKGGEPDLDTAARIVLYDWQRGRIPFFTAPPEAPATPGDGSDAKKAAHPGIGDAEESVAIEDGKADEQPKDSDDPEMPAIEVRQSLAELACKFEYDDEDRRGEATALVKGGGNPGRKRRREGSDEGSEEATGSASKGKKGKKRRVAGEGKPSGVAAGVRPGSVDWKAVVAEFGM